MTDDDFQGDSSDAEALGLWVPIAELAEMRGYARQVMYRKIEKLADAGLIEVRTGKRGVKLVSPPQYDRAAGEVADLAREQGAATRRDLDDGGSAPANSDSAVYTREQARRMAYQAELSQLDLEERRGNLVSIDTLRPMIAAAAEAAVRVIGNLPQEADDIRAICAREDGRELERHLKATANRMRTEIAAAIRSAVPDASANRGDAAESAA